MTTLEIIVFGYIINGIVIITMMLGTLIYMLLVALTSPEDFLQVDLKSQELLHVKNELRKAKISSRTQKDLILLIPFSMIIIVLEYLYGIIRYGYLGYVWREMDNKVQELKNRL